MQVGGFGPQRRDNAQSLFVLTKQRSQYRFISPHSVKTIHETGYQGSSPLITVLAAMGENKKPKILVSITESIMLWDGQLITQLFLINEFPDLFIRVSPQL